MVVIVWITLAILLPGKTNTSRPSSGRTFLYFAYGSNLLTERIHFQNPSATFRDVAKLDGYRLEFRLPSKVNYVSVKLEG